MMKYIRLLPTQSYESNIPKVFIYSFLTEFILILPIWVLFLQQVRGLSLAQVTFTDIAFWATIVLAEVPTGAVADVFGRKISLIIGAVVVGISAILFGWAPTLPLILVANSLWAIGITFNSGAVQAIFYDSLLQLGREEEYTKLRGRLLVVNFSAVALSSFLGGWLGAQDLEFPFYIYSAVTFMGLPFLFRLKEPPQESDPDTKEKLTFRRTLQITADAVRRKPNLRFILLYSSLMPVSAIVVLVLFLQPFAASIGISIAAIGVIVGISQILSAIGSAAAGRIVNLVGAWTWLRLAPFLVFIGVMSLGLFGVLTGIILFGLAAFTEPAIRPLMESLVLKHSPSSVRATILSVDALLARLFLVLIEPGLGVLADQRGLPTTFLVLGLVSFSAIVLTLIGWSRIWKNNGKLPLEDIDEPLPSSVNPKSTG